MFVTKRHKILPFSQQHNQPKNNKLDTSRVFMLVTFPLQDFMPRVKYQNLLIAVWFQTFFNAITVMRISKTSKNIHKHTLSIKSAEKYEY